MLCSDDVHQRRTAVLSFGRVADGLTKPIPVDERLLLQTLQDDSPAVRREAAHAARYLQSDAVFTPLASLLSDPDVGVRRAASESLKQLWPRSRAVLTGMLADREGAAASVILDAMPADDPEMHYPLRGYIQREVANIHFLRSILDVLPRTGKSVSLLADTLRARQQRSEERLIKSVGLFGNPRALDLVRKSLNAGDPSTRAAALEALETLGDRRITQEVIPILDRGGVLASDGEQLSLGGALQKLLIHKDHWLRALAARSIPELGLKDPVEVLQALKTDKDALVKQAVGDALFQMDGKPMKTLKTLSTMDRILLLREVPIFAGLDPDDLEQIAEIAQEQLYSARALICREGEPGASLFLIVNGDVEVVKSSGSDEKVLAIRSVGEFVGEMAILDSAPRSATLRALNEVRALSIEGDAFNMILLDRPQVAVSVLRNMSSRVRELNDKVGANG
jgi:HEAT repeat protein